MQIGDSVNALFSDDSVMDGRVIDVDHHMVCVCNGCKQRSTPTSMCIPTQPVRIPVDCCVVCQNKCAYWEKAYVEPSQEG